MFLYTFNINFLSLRRGLAAESFENVPRGGNDFVASTIRFDNSLSKLELW